MLLANVMYFAGRTVSAYAAQFDVDNAACTLLDRRDCMPGIWDALIEANRGADLRLKFAVRVDIVPLQRLLHH